MSTDTLMAAEPVDLHEDLHALMKEKLPPYVVRCFLAAGYDEADVISSMDTSENPGNSIELIERYISKYFSDQLECYSNPALLGKPFCFPPGHRLRICDFVSKVNKMVTCGTEAKGKKRKQCSVDVPSKRQKSVSVIDPALATTETVTNHVRTSVSKWIKKQKCETLKSLKENEHFAIAVTNSTKSELKSVAMTCLCKSSIQLSQKNATFIISNWTRHALKCNKLMKREDGTGAQHSLVKFFCNTSSDALLAYDAPPDAVDLSPTSVSSSANSRENVANCCPSTEAYNDKVSPSPSNSTVHLSDNSSKVDLSCALPCSSDTTVSDISVKPLTQSEQVFCESPSLDKMSQEAERRGVVDWSRQAREQRKLLKAGSDEKQTRITDYCSLVDEIESLSCESKISECLHSVNSTEEAARIRSFTPVLKKIICNAENNVAKYPHCRRHSAVIKKFATALFIYAGPLAYEFLQNNLPEALPSLRTVQRIVHSEFKTINEGEFRFDDLVAHISQYNAPSIVTVGEDATRVIARVEYDCKTDMRWFCTSCQ